MREVETALDKYKRKCRKYSKAAEHQEEKIENEQLKASMEILSA